MIRRYWGLIRTEFLREFSSPAGLVFFLVLPLLFTGAVGAGLSGMMDRRDAPVEEIRTTIFVVQEDEGPLVEAFLDALLLSNLQPEPVESLPENEFGLEIPADFSERLRAGEAVSVTLHTRPETSLSVAVEQAVSAAQRRVGGAALVAQVGLAEAREQGTVTTPEEEADFFRSVLNGTLEATEEPPAEVVVRWPAGTEIDERVDYMTGSEQASAGQIVTWVQITLLGVMEVLVAERVGGTLRRLLITPTSRFTILSGKLIARLLLGLTQIAILLVGGIFIFGVNWGDDPLALAMTSFAFALATASLGMLLATFMRTPGQANSTMVGLAMGLSALGGAWYPLEVTPEFYRTAVQILPSTWAMRAYTDILSRGATAADVLLEFGVLLSFAAVFLTLASVRFQRYE